MTTLVAEKDKLTAARELLGVVRAVVTQSAHTQIEDVVTFALQSVLEDTSNRFVIEFLNRRNQFEVDLWNQRPDGSREDPVEACGGTLCDTLATALLITVGQLLGVRTPLFLDEVGKHISPDMAPRFGQFLRDVSHRLGRQIILVTHSHPVAEFADKQFRITLEKGVSKVRET